MFGDIREWWFSHDIMARSALTICLSYMSLSLFQEFCKIQKKLRVPTKYQEELRRKCECVVWVIGIQV